MTSLDNTERKFYQDTIVNLLQYNGQLISALITRGGMPPMPTMPLSIPSFGIEMNLDDMKKMQSAWKDMPTSFNVEKMMSEALRRMTGVLPKEDSEEDPLK